MIRVALELGGLCAGANDKQLTALAAFGERFGLVFQITDDLLDTNGIQLEVGKRVGKDTDRGKLTYPGLVGEAESHRMVEQLVEQAEDALCSFGNAAEPLRYLAQGLANRDR